MQNSHTSIHSAEIPPEQRGNLILGILGHLGSPVMYCIILAITGISFTNALIAFLSTSAVFLSFTLVSEKITPSIRLSKPSWKEIWNGLFLVFIKALVIGGSVIALGWFALSHISFYAELRSSWGLVILATMLTDFSYYLLHRFLSHSKGNNPIYKFYRKHHSVHHSVSEMDFLRGNQSSFIDTSFSQFQPSMILVSWLLGMDLHATLTAYGLFMVLQATDHTSVTFNIGWLNYIFMDNHAHKLHHCKRGNLVNHAVAFSIFDRLFGTYYENWNLSSNYLHHHGIPLPIEPLRKANKDSLTAQLPVSPQIAPQNK
jgi:sterol desaturase/sphingolipid hydroxylase (fatty acid hydroxylase superfamily)